MTIITIIKIIKNMMIIIIQPLEKGKRNRTLQ